MHGMTGQVELLVGINAVRTPSTPLTTLTGSPDHWLTPDVSLNRWTLCPCDWRCICASGDCDPNRPAEHQSH